MIYEPREDSYLLQKHVRTYANGKVLDIGTGSGIQALEAMEKTKDVLAVDIDRTAVSYARKQGVNSIQSDLFSNVKGKFDLIIFNPPYLPSDERADDLALTGGKYGYEILERFFSKAKFYLNNNGKILIVFSSITGDIEWLAQQYGYSFKKLEEQSFFFEKIYVYMLELKV